MSGDGSGPAAPAAAWGVMLMHLPGGTIDTVPPKAGIRLRVVGRDGVPTFWDLDSLVAEAIEAELRRHPLIVGVSGGLYGHPSHLGRA